MSNSIRTDTAWKLQSQSFTQPDEIKQSSCPKDDEIKRLVQWNIINEDSSRSFLVYIPPQLCTNLLSSKKNASNVQNTPSLRILLSIHGYGGRPSQEIQKWHSVAIELHTIIIAPQGTVTLSNGRLGWNAIGCCGDPVTNQVDDLGFLLGVIDVVLDTLAIISNADKEHMQVIVTGFSNGGFMSSLLGLQPNRPSWLVGIVPTGGYQYGLELYDKTENDSTPLPMMAHHGGRDGVVKPDGCCNSGNSNPPQSNCPLDIGINQSTCTSVQTAFEKWSQINECKSTSIDDSSLQINESNLQDAQTLYTCWKGDECQASTELCIWTNEGHSWGSEFPGLILAQSWMESVFVESELLFRYTSSDGKEGIEVKISWFRQNAISLFSFSGFMLPLVVWALRRQRSQSVVKRKTSEDDYMFQMGNAADVNAEGNASGNEERVTML